MREDHRDGERNGIHISSLVESVLKKVVYFLSIGMESVGISIH